VRLERASAEARAALDVKKRFQRDYRLHTAVWLGAAAMLGLIVSQVLKRSRNRAPRERLVAEKESRSAPLLNTAGKLLLSAATPFITTWAKQSVSRAYRNR
jgi:hypothetical protein